MTLHALGRHIALVGFMGVGKTTLARRLGQRLHRVVLPIDDEVAQRRGMSIAEIFDQDGEEEFRRLEEEALSRAVSVRRLAVIDAGGGAVTNGDNESAFSQAFTLHVDLDVDTAWRRVRRSDRPLAQDEHVFRALYEGRAPLYSAVADAAVQSGDVDGAVLAAAGVRHEPGSLDRLGELVPGDGPVALVSEPNVLARYGERARVALGERLVSTHELPQGEQAKAWPVVQRLWSELALDRDGTIVALGGGALTDPAGFAAATYLRGVPWVAVPTTLVGQVDAAIGGKTAIDIPEGKNLVGAFHWPARVVIDEELLESLPDRERRQGLAELVKTRLLAGTELDVRGAAAYKSGLCLRDPHDRDVRRFLNLGHTFAHALEAAADFDLPHGEAVALGLLAALQVSGRDTAEVEEALDPQPVAVDRERAWQALLRDKKRTGGDINLVLLSDEGPYVAPRPAAEVRAALDTLIR